MRSNNTKPITSRCRVRKLKPCKQCGKLVSIPKNRWRSFRFCSRRCLWRWHDAGPRRVRIRCKLCSAQFSVIGCRKDTAKYCSKQCYYASQRFNVGSIKLKCEHCRRSFTKSPTKVRTKNYCSQRCRIEGSKRKAAVRARGRCHRCGWKKIPAILVIHHIDRNKRNGASDNLELLCWNCHMADHFLAHDGPYRRH